MYTKKGILGVLFLFFCFALSAHADNRELVTSFSTAVSSGEWREVLYKYPSYYSDGYIYTVELQPAYGDPDIYLHEKVSGTWSSLLSAVYFGSFGCYDGDKLNYDGHPGFDYIFSGVSVRPTASGTVVSTSAGPCIPKGFSSCSTMGAVGVCGWLVVSDLFFLSGL